MTYIFYVLGALAAALGAFEIFNGMRLEGATNVSTGELFDSSFNWRMGVQFLFVGLLLLGAGGVLRRLDRIVHYTRMAALSARDKSGN